MQNTSADNTQTKFEITTAIPSKGIFVQRENNLQIDKITLTQQQPSVVADNAPSKRSLAQRAKREEERQIVMMDATINNTYSNSNVGINGENSFMVATSKRALAQCARREREKRKKTTTFHLQTENNIHRDVYFNWDTSTQQYSRCQKAGNETNAPHALDNAGENFEACRVAPTEILGIDETTNTATRLRKHIFEIGESSRVPIDIVNEPPQKPFMDEHFFSDDNMDLDFEFNIDPFNP
ncbi:hypothetical protein GIB67_024116 [Kingdonia uniflora]|uniref:Uncharacterized protein n=1 Tax=Kingdonia uniflora TaxID=39325 RepID=A0A7J7MMN6_9MAGN|nr:hypothetical protein GIB67_024116 [Kingdonia uniflora]